MKMMCVLVGTALKCDLQVSLPAHYAQPERTIASRVCLLFSPTSISDPSRV